MNWIDRLLGRCCRPSALDQHKARRISLDAEMQALKLVRYVSHRVKGDLGG